MTLEDCKIIDLFFARDETAIAFTAEEADSQPVRKKHGRAKWIAAAACLCLMLCIGIKPLLAADIAAPSAGDLAPMIYVSDTLYYLAAEQPDLTGSESDFVYLGKILSSVSSSEYPAENFQANDDIIGAKVYNYGENIVAALESGYWLYEAYGETGE
ncbi:MAG: hypothetical protein LUE06_09340 [Oscillospiraceae bacterium]|nr:hypothetical protein [Oscillospiraceae bacterium]